MKALQTEIWDSVSASGNEPPVAGKRGAPAVAEEAGDRFRPYQEEARAAWLARIQSGSRRSIVKLPTGSGKTVLGIGTIASWLQQSSGDHCLWLTPRIFLLEDALDRLKMRFPNTHISREQAGYVG